MAGLACRSLGRIIILSCVLARIAGAADDVPASTQAVEFFEKEVRPLLANRCQSCHGPEKQKGDLRLDSRDAILKGGGNGPAITPGKPAESLLIDAVNYGELVQMPPKKKLKEAEIATLSKWVSLGAPWGAVDAHAADPSGGPKVKPFNLQERAKHWSFQPIAHPNPPRARDESWPKTAVDSFVLADLESKGLKPAADADRETLLRRITFDLIGLPPLPDEIQSFLADSSPDAYAKVVDRLLASPHYGERWGRHWLDLVRFAETSGHEFDYDILNAYRYRDYVVRAINADLPYDRFVVEQIAGDLLPTPRRHPSQGFNESILATGFYMLSEGTHSPVDVREDEVYRMDNQIDVTAKTFLGLTVSCARCHDHKFDAITTRDYYALKGYLKSSRFQQSFIDPPDRIHAKAEELERSRKSIASKLGTDEVHRSMAKIPVYLAAAWRVISAPESIDATVASVANVAPAARAIAVVANENELDRSTLELWVRALADDRAKKPGHPLFAWWALSEGKNLVNSDRARLTPIFESAKPTDPAGSPLFEDFGDGTYDRWFVSGDAFGATPTTAAEAMLAGDTYRPLPSGVAHSGRISNKLQGVLCSRTFTLEKKFIHYRVAGEKGRINLIVDGFEKIKDPIYGGLGIGVNHGQAYQWRVQDVSMWMGHNAYIELGDGATTDYGGGQTAMAHGDGFLAIDEIRFSDSAVPPSGDPGSAALLARLAGADRIDSLANAFAKEVAAGYEKWLSGKDELGQASLFVGLADLGLISFGAVAKLDIEAYRLLEATIPEPTLALAITDGSGEDDRVHIRGNAKTLGEVVPRRFLEVLAGPTQPTVASGSGRLELAQKIVDRANPLTPRVMVNRIWKHHFGEGIVKSTDDFGVMGQPPSHPELLDYLATEFQKSGWSIKQMHRLIVLSHAYQMSSRLDSGAEAKDPNNRLLHRMNVRRLEAEEVRDAILAVSGRLDGSMFGPGVAPYLTPFMTGRGRPGVSGPLDGSGRRSLYLNVRRNFLAPMLLAFDYPTPASTMGRRNVSNLPAQALTLLNDPFVVGEARRWSEKLRAGPGSSDQKRLEIAYESAFARKPTADECAAALAFLATRTNERSQAEAWAELCHVLINVKEFIYIP